MLFFFFNLKLIKILSSFFLVTHFVQSREEFMFFITQFVFKFHLFTLILLRFDFVVCLPIYEVLAMLSENSSTWLKIISLKK
jgi:hypothetical protein